MLRKVAGRKLQGGTCGSKRGAKEANLEGGGGGKKKIESGGKEKSESGKSFIMLQKKRKLKTGKPIKRGRDQSRKRKIISGGQRLPTEGG